MGVRTCMLYVHTVMSMCTLDVHPLTPAGARVQVLGSGNAVRFEELVNWEDQALQARFSGMVQYLKAANKYGLLQFEGDMPQKKILTSSSLYMSRKELLSAVMEQPQLIGSNMEGMPMPRPSNRGLALPRSPRFTRLTSAAHVRALV